MSNNNRKEINPDTLDMLYAIAILALMLITLIVISLFPFKVQ